MTRPLTQAMADALRDGRPLALLAEINHPSGVARFWTGVGDIVYNGFTFTGAGRFGTVAPVMRTSDLAIQEVVFSLSGVLPEEAAELETDVRNEIATVWLACIGEHGEIVASPYQLLSALLDFQSLSVGEEGEAILSITGRTGFYTLERAIEESWTAEDQKQIYPTDTGFDMVASLQNQDVQWTPT